MRTIRIFFVVTLAIVLILVAAANRAPVTVGLLPETIAAFTGRAWTLTMPAFVALFLAMVFGVLVGLVWEWLREAHIRSEASRRAGEVARLEREVGALRDQHKAPRDEVLAILDGQKTGNTLPAPR